jgi:DNA sulfur modification protein DndB
VFGTFHPNSDRNDDVVVKDRKQTPAAAASVRPDDFEYVFPAIRGIQAGREYYVAMFPLHLVPRIFVYNEEDVPAPMRAQRSLNRARVPEMARYITDNPDSYVFSALTASVNSDVIFDSLPLENGPANRLGTLTIPMSAKLVINDGQHRRAAIQQALQDNSDLGDESIAIVLHPAQQVHWCALRPPR